MRKLVLSLAVAAMACGSSSSNSNSVTGTIGGSSFSPAEVAGFYVAPQTCNLPVVGSTPLTAIGIFFNSTTNTCNDVVQCVAHRSAREVTVVIAKFPLIQTGAQPSITTGDYTIAGGATSISQPQSVDPNTGIATIAFATATRTANDVTCTPTVSFAAASPAGTVHISDVSATHIAGTVNLTFEDGGTLSGSFSVTPCGTAPNVCTLAQAGGLCSGAPTCQ